MNIAIDVTNLLNLIKKTNVNLTGNFFPSDLDYFYEISLTEEWSMNQPEFIFKFKDIQLVKWQNNCILDRICLKLQI